LLTFGELGGGDWLATLGMGEELELRVGRRASSRLACDWLAAPNSGAAEDACCCWFPVGLELVGAFGCGGATNWPARPFREAAWILDK